MSNQSDVFSFRLEILKKELDTIEQSIRKIDDIANSVKNWAILVWTGSIVGILGKPEIHKYILFTAAPPLIFMFVDAFWRRIQRRFQYRQGKIADFLNSKQLDRCFEDRKLEFQLLDPIGRQYHKRDDFGRFLSLHKILRFQTVSFIYVGLSILSIVLAIILMC